MRATINTDASYSNRHRVGAFAFWIATDEGRFRHSGILKGEITDSEEAELRCIANAFACLDKLQFNRKISHIIVNTDCKHAIGKIRSGHLPKKASIVWGVAYWISQRIKAMTEVKVEFRYVEAHRFKKGGNYDTARHFVNDWCDKAAKHHMTAALLNPDAVKAQRADVNISLLIHGTSPRDKYRNFKPQKFKRK